MNRVYLYQGKELVKLFSSHTECGKYLGITGRQVRNIINSDNCWNKYKLIAVEEDQNNRKTAKKSWSGQFKRIIQQSRNVLRK